MTLFRSAKQSYVRFTSTGVYVDLNRFLATPQGQQVVRNACRGPNVQDMTTGDEPKVDKRGRDARRRG